MPLHAGLGPSLSIQNFNIAVKGSCLLTVFLKLWELCSVNSLAILVIHTVLI